MPTTIPLDQLETYAFCDPASSKKKYISKRRARQAIVVGARDWLSRWFVVYTWAGRVPASELRDRIIETQARYRPRRFGLEANGMQVLFGDLVREEARRQLGHVSFLPVYQPTKVAKDYRIRAGLEPVINDGRLFILDKTSPLAVEIRGFPTSATKDLVDALESMIRLAPKRVRDVERDQEYERYASYLRSTGCSPHIMKEKLRVFSENALN